MVLRFLIGVLGGFYVLVHALVGQTAPRDRVGQAIGSLQAISMVTLAIIPPVAGLFTDVLGVRSSFLLGAAIMLVSFWVMWRGYDAEPQPANRRSAADGSGRQPTRPGRKPRGVGLGAAEQPRDGVVSRSSSSGSTSSESSGRSRRCWSSRWSRLGAAWLDDRPGARDRLGGDGALGAGLRAAGPTVPARVLLLVSLACGCPDPADPRDRWTRSGSSWPRASSWACSTGGIITLAYAHVSTLLPSDRLSVSFSMFASVAMVASAVGPVSMSTLATTAGLRSPLLVGAVGFAVLLRPAARGRRTRWPTVRAPRQEGLPPGG